MKYLTVALALLAPLASAGCGGGTLFANSGAGSTGASGSSSTPTSTPTITSILPVGIDAGAASAALTINGSSFLSGAVFAFNGANVPTQFVSGTELTATLSAANLIAGGDFPVTVTNPDGGTASSTIGIVNPPPVITALSPASVLQGALPQTLTITGTGLNPSTLISFNGATHLVTVLSPTQLAIILTGGDLAAAAVAPVVATNPAPGGGASAPFNFLINNPAPTISGFSPAALPAGAAPQPLLINGSGFVNGSAVVWNGSTRGATFLNATQISFTPQAGDLAASGFQSVAISNPAPGGGNSAPASFAVNGPAPAVTAVAPSSGIAGSAATLTISGSNFSPGALVSWGSPAQLLAPTTIAPAQIVVTVPANLLASAGSYALAVVNPAPGGGTAPVAGGFTVQNPAVTLTSMLPVTAPLNDPNPVPVTLCGSGFATGVSTVLVNGVAVSAVVNNASQITFELPAADLTQSGILPVTVSNSSPCAGATCVSNPLYFSVGAPTATPAGIAVITEKVKQLAGGFQTQDVAYVPLAAIPGQTQAEIDVVQLDTIDLPPFLPINGFITNAAPYATPGIANGAFVNVPETAPGASGTAGTAVLNRIALPAGYNPSITVADAADNQVLVSSAQSPVVYSISLATDPASQSLSGSYSLAASITAAPIEFSDYLCSGVCALVVDQSGIAAHNFLSGSTQQARALAMTPNGLLNLNAVTGAVAGPCLATVCGGSPGPDFGYSSTGSSWNVLNPFYLPDNTLGLQYMTLNGSGAVSSLTIPIGTRPASGVIDPATQLGLVADEGTGVNTLVNLFQPPSPLPASFGPPATGFYIGAGSVTCASRPDWTMTALDSGTHLLLSAQEFAGCLAVTQLPVTPVVNAGSGTAAVPTAPLMNTQQKFGLVTAPQGPYTASPPWGTITNGLDPDGLPWSNGFDPYKFAVYSSVLSGQPTALLLEPQLSANTACSGSVPGVWLAEVPLPSLLSASGASAAGEVPTPNMAQLATFIRLRAPSPSICGPAQFAQGTTVTQVTITGAGFVGGTIASYAGTSVTFSGTTVTWDGVPQTVDAITPNSITFSLTPASMSLGAHTVGVSLSPAVYGSIGGSATWTVEVVPASSTGGD